MIKGIHAILLFLVIFFLKTEGYSGRADTYAQPDILFSVEANNDAFIFWNSVDYYYTSGEKISIGLRNRGPLQYDCFSFLNHVDLEIFDSFVTSYDTFSFIQNMYTPHNISISTLITNDRPYAGWIRSGYLHSAVFMNPDKKIQDTASIYLSVGLLGNGEGREAQTLIHEGMRTINPNTVIPMGWDNRIPESIAFQFSVDNKVAYRDKICSWLGFGVSYDPVIEFGNVFGRASCILEGMFSYIRIESNITTNRVTNYQYTIPVIDKRRVDIPLSNLNKTVNVLTTKRELGTGDLSDITNDITEIIDGMSKGNAGTISNTAIETIAVYTNEEIKDNVRVELGLVPFVSIWDNTIYTNNSSYQLNIYDLYMEMYVKCHFLVPMSFFTLKYMDIALTVETRSTQVVDKYTYDHLNGFDQVFNVNGIIDHMIGKIQFTFCY